MLRGNRGATSYTVDPPAGAKGAAAKYYAVYMPIRLGTTFWSIIVASSEDEVLSSLVSFRNRLALIMSLLLVGGTGFAFLGMKAWLIVREEEKRRRVEEALRESEERFRGLADSLPQTVFESDAGGRVLYANRAGLESFGYTAEDLSRGVQFLEMLVPADRDRALQNMQARFRGELAPQEYVALRKDGSTFPVIAHTAPVLRAGAPAGLRGLVVDITERKQSEVGPAGVGGAVQEHHRKRQRGGPGRGRRVKGVPVRQPGDLPDARLHAPRAVRSGRFAASTPRRRFPG